MQLIDYFIWEQYNGLLYRDNRGRTKLHKWGFNAILHFNGRKLTMQWKACIAEVCSSDAEILDIHIEFILAFKGRYNQQGELYFMHRKQHIHRH